MNDYEKAVDTYDLMSREEKDEAFRKALTEDYGQTWTTSELQQDFTVIGFGGGYCVVERRSDGQKGSLGFTHMPRFYHSFVPDNK